MAGVIRGYVRWMDAIADYVGLIAMYLIFVMIGVLLLDVVSDKVFGIPLHWCVEFAQFTMAAFYFMAGAKTLKDNDHVRMDLIYANFSERGRARMDVVTVLCLMFYLGVMLWGSVSSLTYSYETDQRLPSIWNPSLVPIKVLMVGCIILMLLQSLSLFFKYWAAARGPRLA